MEVDGFVAMLVAFKARDQGLQRLQIRSSELRTMIETVGRR